MVHASSPLFHGRRRSSLLPQLQATTIGSLSQTYPSIELNSRMQRFVVHIEDTKVPQPQSILCPMLWLRYMPHTCNSYHIVTQMKYCALRNARGWPLVQVLPFLNYHRLTAASTLVKDLVFPSRWPALILIICH